MSHFSVLVVSRTPEQVAELLAPYQENGMGDCPREYLVFDDDEDEYRKEFDEKSIEMVRAPDGELLYTWDRRFKQGGILNQTTVIPEGYEKVRVYHKDRYASFEEFMADWAGYSARDEETSRYGIWRNPNAKWDWYVLGGRWTGMIMPKKVVGKPAMSLDEVTDPKLRERIRALSAKTVANGATPEEAATAARKIADLMATANATGAVDARVGRPGLDTMPGKGVDQIRKGDIDFDAMLAEERDCLAKRWDKEEAEFALTDLGKTMTYRDAVNRYIVLRNDLRKMAAETSTPLWTLFNEHPEGAALRDALPAFTLADRLETPVEGRGAYINTAKPISTYAILTEDGQWLARSEMGWVCVSHDSKTNDEWRGTFDEFLASVPDDRWLSIVDCHT